MQMGRKIGVNNYSGSFEIRRFLRHKLACIKLAPNGKQIRRRICKAKPCKTSPTDVFAEEGPVFSFENPCTLYLATWINCTAK
jgi:hypothetical protein